MDTLTQLSSITGGLESFGEAGQLMAAASGYKSNAALLDVSAKGEIAAGELQAKRVAVQGEKYVSRMRSMYAKANVKLTGTPAAMWAESERNAQLDIVNTKLNAAARANAYGFEALQNRLAAGRARTAAWAKAGQGVLKIGTGMAMANSGNGMSPTDVENYVSGS
jgi:L-fucose isomerase-like protein